MTESRLSIVIDSQDSEKQVNDLTKRLTALEKAGIRVTGSANDSTGAYERASKSAKQYGNNTQTATKRMNVMNGIAGKLAATLATIGFSAMIKNTLDTADEMGKLSLRLGETVENLSRLQYAARLTGVTTQTLNMGLQRMGRRVSEAANGTGEAVGALQELNLSAERMNQLSPADQFNMLADALEGVPNQADRMRLAMKLLDSEGVALLQTMEGGSDAIRRMGEESDATGNTISTEFAAKAAEANDALTKLTATGQGMLNEFVVLLAPALTETAGLLSENAETVVFITGAIATLTVGLKAARLAQIAFNAAVRANPYVLVASLIGTAVAALVGYKTMTQENTTATSEYKDEMDELALAVGRYTNATLRSKKSELLIQLQEEQTAAFELHGQIQEVQGLIRNSGQLTPQGGAMPTATYEDIQRGRELNTQLEERKADIAAINDGLLAINRQMRINNEVAEEGNDQTIVTKDQVKEALAALQQLRQGYDEAGLAREEYAERQEQLNLLMREGKIGENTYRQAMAEAASQLNETIHGIKEAESAYESLRGEFDQMGLATEAFDTGLSHIETLLDQGIISLQQYTQALEALGNQYRQAEIESDPMLKAQDELKNRFIENSALLNALREQSAALQMPGNVGAAISWEANSNVGDEVLSGLETPTFNAESAVGDVQNMENYQAQYEIRLEQLREFENEKYGIQAEATAAREALEQSHEEKMQSYREQMLNAQLSSTASMFGSLLSVSAQYFGESSGLTRTFMIFQQAAQAAQAIMSINTGIANAAALPFPANIPAMASVVSATAGLVGNIMSISAPPEPSFSAPSFAGAYDTGGNIPKGQWGIVGEKGPEIVNGPANVTGRKDTADLLGNSGGTNVSVTVNYTNKGGKNSEEDSRKQGREIADLVKGQVLQIIRSEQRPGGSLYK